MATDGRDQRDLVLAPGEYAHIMDKTKGQIVTYVGPNRASLSTTDEPIKFDQKAKRFTRTDNTEQAIQAAVTAPEGYYILLKNPAKENIHPVPGTPGASPVLEIGHKIVVHGPASFVPWPGQMTKVVKGHHLRSNQYVLVRVYDEKSARENWRSTVAKTVGSSSDAPTDLPVQAEDLTTGKNIVIKGTDVSFYMPPTGVEVVPDQEGNFVRNAVTLERLEYCVLIDEDGNKRNVRGPAVVFPEPTEVFKTIDVMKDGRPVTTRKFRAYELTENSGIHLKVIAEYQDGEGQQKVGDELFITGKEQMIYFPREEQAIVKYGGQEIHYAIAIPKGEARYVMNRNTGDIRLEKGPVVFLPDPRKEVVVLRVLEPKICELLYPGNQEALQKNLDRLGKASTSAVLAVAAAAPAAFYAEGLIGSATASLVDDTMGGRGLRGAAAKDFGGDAFERNQQYTPPRTITLNSKYDGAVTTRIWSGYAIMLVSKDGTRRVVEGPQTVLLGYDEDPQVLKLSTQTPKSGKSPIRTVFLRTKGKVSDILEVETSDYCKVSLRVAYRVAFEGDKNQWFDIEDYVGFLADHMRSRLRAGVVKQSIQDFYGNPIEILRDIVLGKPDEKGKRPGLLFEENGMKIYDLDVLDTKIEGELEKRLIKAKQDSFDHGLAIEAKQRDLEFSKKTSAIETELASLSIEVVKAKLERDLEQIKARAQTEDANRNLQDREEMFNVEKQKYAAERNRIIAAQKTEADKASQDLKIEFIKTEVEAFVRKGEAISPDLIKALDTFGERVVVERLVQAMGPLSLLGGTSVADIVKKMFAGTKLADIGLAATNGVSAIASAASQPQS